MTKSSLYKASTFLLLSAASVGATAAAQTPNLEEMWELIQQQQQEIEALKAEAAIRENQFLVVEERLDDTADAVVQVAEMRPPISNAGGTPRWAVMGKCTITIWKIRTVMVRKPN